MIAVNQYLFTCTYALCILYNLKNKMEIKLYITNIKTFTKLCNSTSFSEMFQLNALLEINITVVV